MFSKTRSAAIRGIDMLFVTVETDVCEGLPSIDMVGLLNSEVREARERVRTAVRNTGIIIPPKRITINLSPADIRKEGGFFDLPIAVGILCALGKIKSIYNMEETVIVGELSLDGTIKGVRGVLAMALCAMEQGYKNIIVPWDNVYEACAVRQHKCGKDINVIGVRRLKEAVDILNGDREPEGIIIMENKDGVEKESQKEDFGDMCGQENLKRASLVAAAGRHNILFVGPPGSGKTMAALRIPSILSKPDIEECIEITKIHSAAGQLKERGIIRKRPFRNPHHTITGVAMAGGGSRVTPGEITLAHRGVLFLDELAEFRRETLEILRQPLESGRVVIVRNSGIYVFPADIMLVAATNPCRCGYYPDRNKCRCTDRDVQKYMGKISGPLMSRIDITVTSPLFRAEDFQHTGKKLSSHELRKKVEGAAVIQRERYKGTNIRFNSELNPGEINKYCYLGKNEKSIIKEIFASMEISARAYYKILKTARTIADIEGKVNIEESHIAEAVGYRSVV